MNWVMISKNQIKYVKQLEQKKHRQREGLFVAEGPKVVGDLLAAGFAPRQLFATGEWTPPQAQHSPTLITTDELHRISFLQHPQHVLALFPLPEADGNVQPRSEGLTLALDGIQDPGNLGTIIRIADWFGIDHIVCSNDTADAWNPKVVQATMGSIARVSIAYTDLPSYLDNVHTDICGTFLDGDDIYCQNLPADAVIVMGNEGKGISPAVRERVTRRLLIPSFPHLTEERRNQRGAESLNVAIATAITCSEFRRKQLKKNTTFAT